MRAAVYVAICGVAAVAIGDDGTWLQAGASVSASKTLRETRHVGNQARGAAAAYAAAASTDNCAGMTCKTRRACCSGDRVTVAVVRARAAVGEHGVAAAGAAERAYGAW